ncbi:hypothetical protein AAVH_27936, partial [Aphelenchoides avenae]
TPPSESRSATPLRTTSSWTCSDSSTTTSRKLQRRVLPAWADIVASKERFLPREQLGNATISGNGGIAITSYSIKPGAPPGRMTRSRAQLGGT